MSVPLQNIRAIAQELNVVQSFHPNTGVITKKVIDDDEWLRREHVKLNWESYKMAYKKEQSERYQKSMKKGRFDDAPGSTLRETKHMHRVEVKEWMWITLNPPEETDLNKFIKLVKKVTSKKWIDSYIFVIEQGGKTEENMGHHPHAHILLHHDNYRHDKFYSEITNSLLSIWTPGQIENDRIINFRPSHEEKDVIGRYQYCKGIKKDDEKFPTLKIDEKWRAIKMIPNFFQKNMEKIMEKTASGVIQEIDECLIDD